MTIMTMVLRIGTRRLPRNTSSETVTMTIMNAANPKHAKTHPRFHCMTDKRTLSHPN